VGHGFRQFILANGHGSNMPLIDMAARLTIIEHPESIACDYTYLLTPRAIEVLKSVRESEFPRGIAHACEAEKDISFPPSDYFYFDGIAGGPGSMMEYWSTLSRTGTMGDPTLATAKKGEVLFEAAVTELVAVIEETKARRIRPRIDHHGTVRPVPSAEAAG
jgi:creatinine amidohydrolase